MESLLLSEDLKLIAAIQSVCPNAGITLKPCSGSEEGIALLARRKIYAVIVDHANSRAASELMDAVLKSSSNKNAVTIAVISDYGGDPLKAMFVLMKPVSAELMLRTLRAAQGPMFKECRRYFRHPLQVPVTITTPQNQELQAISANVSQHGLAIRFLSPELITSCTAVGIRCELPGTFAPIELKGEIVWSTRDAKAGVRCRGVTPKDRKEWEAWLLARSLSTVPLGEEFRKPLF